MCGVVCITIGEPCAIFDRAHDPDDPLGWEMDRVVHCEEDNCRECGERDCPHASPDHYSTEGCPECTIYS